ncbi:MAG: formate--tetrahydrofolate ligase [Armatimonadetes bacterium]|nr:formate--tetrahydrofolate ligase [Armatimonadota bacterium]
MNSDLEIAQAATMKPILEIAEAVGIGEDELDLHGKWKAKVHLDILERVKDRPQGKYIDVTAITPTPLGEGKTVTTIGLSQALGVIGKNVMTCIRQPSLGPVFGIKGGAAGGGHSQVVPMEDFNLHLTGDVHAVSITNNLLAAMIDAHIKHGNELGIDPRTISWRRVIDLNDKWGVYNIVSGLGGENRVPRETGFDISVASEVMAILALATSLQDLRERLGRIIFGQTWAGDPVTAEDLGAAGAMAVLMKDALLPTLMQTLENTPVFVHAGPFANIAHGNSSIVADQVALKLADYVVTESGFGADCGMEKFFNIKCRISGLQPDCVVIVATVRALKMHGGVGNIRPGKPLPPELVKENLPALEKGCANLEKHIENARLFGIPVVVAVNRFTEDTDAEVKLIQEKAVAAGAEGAYLSEVWAKGGEGGRELAEAVAAACEKPTNFQLLYPDDASIKEKIEAIATRVYGADGVDYDWVAEQKIEAFTKWGLDKLPICMAKTHLSLSHDSKLKGRPTGFRVPVRDIRPSAGAGFLYPLLGTFTTMPGLPSKPAALNVDIDKDGKVVGLF